MNVRVVNLSQWMTDDIVSLVQHGLNMVGNKKGVGFLVFSPERFGTNNNYVDDQTSLDGERTELQYLAYCNEAPVHYVENMFRAITRKLGAEVKRLPGNASAPVVRRRFEKVGSAAEALLPILEGLSRGPNRTFHGWFNPTHSGRMSWLQSRLSCCEDQDVEPVLKFLGDIAYRYETTRLSEMRANMKASRERRSLMKEVIAASRKRMAAEPLQGSAAAP